MADKTREISIEEEEKSFRFHYRGKKLESRILERIESEEKEKTRGKVVKEPTPKRIRGVQKEVKQKASNYKKTREIID